VILSTKKRIQMRFDNVWRLSAAQALAVASAGGAASSIRVCLPGSTSSTGGCRFAIVDPQTPAISSTTAALLPANFIEVVKVTPGQRVSAISKDAGAFSLSITELTD
jgi:hypothetical protein